MRIPAYVVKVCEEKESDHKQNIIKHSLSGDAGRGKAAQEQQCDNRQYKK